MTLQTEYSLFKSVNNEKKLLQIILLLLPAMIIVSCSKEDKIGVPDDEGETTEVYIKFSQPGTRAQTPGLDESTPGSGKYTATFSSGMLVFVDNIGKITKKVTINAGSETGPHTTSVGIDDLTTTNGARIESVPKTSKTVHVYGNIPTGGTHGVDLSTANTFDQLNAMKIHIATQMAADNGVSNVMLYGSDPINYIPDPAVANPEVSPIVSRIEIEQFGMKTGSTIKEFRVDGIFMNNTYTHSAPDGSVTTTDLMDLGMSNDDLTTYLPTDATYNSKPGLYLTDYANVWYDYAAAGLAGNFNGSDPAVYKPSTTGDVWAYHAFATNPGLSTGEDCPHMVIRLSNIVKQDNSTLNGVWFLTVVKFIDTGGNDIYPFPAGKILKVSSINFTDQGDDEGDLDDRGEKQSVPVVVTVDIKDWKIENVTTGFIGR